MLEKWKSLSGYTRFSVWGFLISAILGLFSMGVLGALLYYCLFFLHDAYPSFNDWHGDWVWAALIGVGVAWSLGFLIAGISCHYLHRKFAASLFSKALYVLVLWAWAALLWGYTLSVQFPT